MFYYKQFGYAAIPPGLAIFIYLFWKCYSKVRNIPWRGRETVSSHNPKDKMVVTLCVLLVGIFMFFKPTFAVMLLHIVQYTNVLTFFLLTFLT